MLNKRHKFYISALCAAFVFCVVSFLIHIYCVNQFNFTTHVIKSAVLTSHSSSDFGASLIARPGENWLKRDVTVGNIHGTFTGSTFDLKAVNNTAYKIKEWNFRINIQGDCYINQDWCGAVDIHQFRKNNETGEDEEKSQCLFLKSDLSSHTESIEIDYYREGQDILIPLKAGDYIVYYPSEVNGEFPIEAATEKEAKTITSGIIFYYLDTIDTSDTELTFKLEKSYMFGVWPKIILITFILFLICTLVEISVVIAAQKVKEQMKFQLSGLSTMSDIYDHLYSVDLIYNKFEEVPRLFESKIKIENIENPIEEIIKNTSDPYCKIVGEFVDLKTLPTRLKGKNSIVCEFKHKDYGWCSIRFVQMEKDSEGNLKKVLFSVRLINDEREEMESINDKLEKFAQESKSKGDYLYMLSKNVQNRLKNILNCNKAIMTSSDDFVKLTARKINSESNITEAMVASVMDFIKIKENHFEAMNVDYAIQDLMAECIEIANAKAAEKNIVVESDLSPQINIRVNGEFLRIKAIIIVILSGIIEHMKEGSIKLSIYGKVENKILHGLFSVKTSGKHEPFNFDVNDFKVGKSILKVLNSELKVATLAEQNLDFYFSLDQTVIE